ncbi:NADH-quinone oxidoreductase subunit J, partial [Fulvivirga sp. RKSG066]|uniref:NADH-quinone oxidoreductase subunit J family protein n=1 Tax=Fulvivirga aurantia TaxID=2529383 RepID=UPI0012BB6656
MIEVLFYIFGGLAVLGALLVLITKNVLYAACSLVVAFLGVAAIYVLAGAEFLAITQIMIYVGGIVVLMIFGVMLTNRLSGKALIASSHNQFWGLIAGGAIFSLLLLSLFQVNLPIIKQSIPEFDNIRTLGVGLMSDYILPFEVAAILLLLALV